MRGSEFQDIQDYMCLQAANESTASRMASKMVCSAQCLARPKLGQSCLDKAPPLLETRVPFPSASRMAYPSGSQKLILALVASSPPSESILWPHDSCQVALASCMHYAFSCKRLLSATRREGHCYHCCLSASFNMSSAINHISLSKLKPAVVLLQFAPMLLFLA